MPLCKGAGHFKYKAANAREKFREATAIRTGALNSPNDLLELGGCFHSSGIAGRRCGDLQLKLLFPTVLMTAMVCESA